MKAIFKGIFGHLRKMSKNSLGFSFKILKEIGYIKFSPIFSQKELRALG